MAGADFNVQIYGIERTIRSFQSLDRELRRNANGELRKASREIAREVPNFLGGSGSPQESAIITAARPKSDRYVVVAVPGVVPALTGLKRKGMSAREKKSIGFAIEKGSSAKQFRRPPRGSLVARNLGKIRNYAVPRYAAKVNALVRQYGLG